MPLYRGEYIPNVEALPPASADYRGMQLRVPGGTGAADVVAVCVKDGSGDFAWQRVAGGGTTINVLDYGATGDGVTDDTAALEAAFTAAATAGATAWIPAGIFKASAVSVPANAVVDGIGTILNTTADSYALTVDGANATVKGITIDGGGIGGGIRINADDVTISGGTVGDLGGVYPYDMGISAFGQRGLLIERNHLHDLDTGILLDRAQSCVVRENTGNTISSNFITFWCISDPGVPLAGNRVERNIGTNLSRMLIELFSSDQDDWRYDAPVITDNEGYWATPVGTNTFGLSITASDGAQIKRNKLVKSGVPATEPTGYGIELVTGADVRAESNYVSGFGTGIIANESPRSAIVQNDVWYCVDGILTYGESPNCAVDRNRIYEARDHGVFCNNPTGDGFNGLRITDNLIRRSAEWPDDATTTFDGILHPAPTRDIVIAGNTIELIQAAPTVSLFYGIWQSGTASTGVAYVQENDIRTTATVAFGSGIAANSGLPSITGYVYRRNRFTNLDQVLSFALLDADVGDIIAIENVNNGCTTTNVSSMSKFFDQPGQV